MAFTDINSPGVWRPKPSPAPAQKPPPEPEPAAVKPKPEPEVELGTPEFIRPSNGYQQNQSCKIRVPLTFIKKTISKNLTIKVTAYYKGKPDVILKEGTAEYVESEKAAIGEIKTFFWHDGFLNDNAKPVDATFEVEIEAWHSTVEKHVVGARLTLPDKDSKEAPLLKRGMYDDAVKTPTGTEKIAGSWVKEWQQNLIKLRYLADKSDTGDFDEKTETATKQFQQDSLKKPRLSETSRKMVEVQSISFAGTVDGVVGPKTRKEYDRWKTEHFLRPIVTLFPGDYDLEAVHKNIKQDRKDDAYHAIDKPVVAVQNHLQKVNVYTGCIVDGWFGDKMKAAVIAFQESASAGKFVFDGVEKALEQKLTGFKKGVMDVATHVYLKKIMEKGGKVAKDSALMHYPLPKEHRDKGYHSGARAFGSNRSEDRVHAGCDLYAPAGTKVYAIADGVINQYYDYYWQTYALEVNHAGKTVLYGEIQPPKNNHGYSDDIPPENLRNGLADGVNVKGLVKRGQHIAYVGQLRPIDKKSGKRYNFSDTMVHFEMYKGTATGELTQKNNMEYENVPKKKYMRRKDILNPTEELDKMSDD